MKLLLLIVCCSVATAQDGHGFYFPDQIPTKAESNSNAWSDGSGNSQASASSNAVAGGTGISQPHDLPPAAPYPPTHHEPIGHGHHGGPEFGGGFNQGYPTEFNRPGYEPHPYPPINGVGPGASQLNAQANANVQSNANSPGFGIGPGGSQSNAQANAQSNSQGFGPSQSNSQSNAQANSQNFGNGNTISNAISNSQTTGPNGQASAAAAAASAGTAIINGIPVATAAAAASVASTSGGSVSSSSSAGGPQFPGPNYFGGGPNNYREQPPFYSGPGYARGPYSGPYPETYNRPVNHYNEGPVQQPFFYRSALDKKDDDATSTDAEIIDANLSEFNNDRIPKSSKSVTVKISKPEGGTVIFKD